MAIRCKFHILSVTRTLMQSYDSVKQVSTLKEGDTFKFHVVSGGADATQEDKDFFMSTPNGNLEFSSVNPATSAALQLGKKYYITITEAPD